MTREQRIGTQVRFRPARPSDAEAIAALHADSWRRHYRGAYSDSFLEGDVDADHLTVWTHRLREPNSRHCTIAAEGDSLNLIGFAHTAFDDDPTWGSLLDNLHVAHDHHRRGVGSQLLALTLPTVVARRTGLYLWVLEQNTAAQAFYEALGARRIERALVSPPGGIASRLNGSPAKLRYAWSDPALLRSARAQEGTRAACQSSEYTR